MKVATPVAVIGIRGTAVLLDINSVDGRVAISVADQQDGQVHSVQVFRCAPTNVPGVCSAGDPIGTVTSNGPSLSLTPAANQQVIAQEIGKTPGLIAQEFSSFQQVLSTYDAGKQQFPNLPQHTENTNQNNNSNTTTTKTALGSTPVLPTEPPVTTVFADSSNVKAQGGASLIPAALSIDLTVVGSASGSSTPQSLNTTQLIVVKVDEPIAISNAGGATNQFTQTITGTVDPAFAGTTVTLLDTYNGITTPLGTAIVGSGGVWSASVALKGDGSHSIVAQDPTANSISSAPVVFTLQTTPPSVSITSPGGQAAQLTQTIFGTVVGSEGEAAVGSTVTLYDTLNGVTRQVGTAPVGSNGAWTGTVTLSGNGSNSIVAQDTDAAGNTGASAPVTFTLATTSPTIAITTPIAVDNIINKSEAAAGVSISGTATPGSAAVNGQTATITIVDSTNVVRDTYTATVTNGTWSVAVTAAQAQALADGSYTVKANVSDAARNAAPTASQAITVDETSPTIAINAINVNNIVNKSEAAAGVSISGTASDNGSSTDVNGQTATITIVDSTNVVRDTYTATVTNGTWSVAVTAAQAQALADGSYTVKANVSDAAGNAAPTASQAIAIETVAPTVTISTTGSTTNQATQSISGTVAAATGEAAVGPTVTLFDTLNGVTTQIGTAPVINGSWTGSVLLSGANSIVAQDTDAAGNTGSSAPVTYTLSIIPGGWSAANGGSWNNPANWSSGSVPTSTANVTFNSIGAPLPYSVIIPVGTTITVNSIALNDPETTIVDQGALAIASSLITTAGSWKSTMAARYLSGRVRPSRSNLQERAAICRSVHRPRPPEPSTQSRSQPGLSVSRVIAPSPRPRAMRSISRRRVERWAASPTWD
jgi:hypothetical protein